MSTHRLATGGSASAPLRFTKGHGTRNDFVVIDDPDGDLELGPDAVAALCDRRGGIGGDGMIRVVRTRRTDVDAPADAPEWFMDYRNADGSIAEMCGNGVRVFGAFLSRAGRLEADEKGIRAADVWTRAGVRRLELLAEPAQAGEPWQVRVGMGPAAISEGPARTVRVDGFELPAWDVDMGNPHAIAELPEGVSLEDLDLTARPVLDPEPEHGANIELVSRRGLDHVAMRVFERGVGETQSCGTGTAAVGVLAAQWAGSANDGPWRVDVPGGVLEVARTPDGEITLTGPAELVADGETTLPLS
ncbi:diaminopimelate epimerase [Brachybacterium endophyticum]|uniref:Diaminopimelate epimerase n=1 Tax=Brachybacterium endophyticum TaxID=2182385 RepID=A0A2U2RMP7_9MICO|nr:diaminopimelate epimerase [Brachybacterium endophyticum]PWH07054.1 diaminopimelate epimerase [Brachybacterium endophyticum]